MSIVKVNAIVVPEENRAVFEERFAKRAGAVENQPGFEQFLLLRPTNGDEYHVLTIWASEEAFQAWLTSDDFRAAHAHVASSDTPAPAPAGHGSRLLEFEVLSRVDAPS